MSRISFTATTCTVMYHDDETPEHIYLEQKWLQISTPFNITRLDSTPCETWIVELYMYLKLLLHDNWGAMALRRDDAANHFQSEERLNLFHKHAPVVAIAFHLMRVRRIRSSWHELHNRWYVERRQVTPSTVVARELREGTSLKRKDSIRLLQ